MIDKELFEEQGDIERAVLFCGGCHIVVPVCKGFPLFTEARPYPATSLASWVAQLEEAIFTSEYEYSRFLKLKAERGMIDLYAAFQPFNESTRALYPFLPLLRDQLHPGDIILDTWCRTGWSAELLAGLFPEQQVIALWEGNSNVLGYRGFDYWLGSAKRASNLDVVFTHPDHALPLASNSVAFVHGLDSLHRYRHLSFIPEVLRVCRDEGVLVFPHIHLSNSEPEPFFERGCHQYHGGDWKRWLEKLTKESGRSAWVIPEVSLFEQESSEPLADDHDTKHYNALIAIAPSEWEGQLLVPGVDLEFSGQTHFVLNPLVDINLHTGRISREGTLSGEVEHLLARHPCYRERLTVCGESITARESLFCWYARQGFNLDEIVAVMRERLSDIVELARALCRRELLHPAPVSAAMFQLQQFFGLSELPSEPPSCFADIWVAAKGGYADRDVLHWLNDGSRLGYEDADFLVGAIRKGLEQAGLAAGSRLAIYSHHHPEATLVIWSAWLSGIAVVPIDPELPPSQVITLLNFADAEMLFTDRPIDMSSSVLSAILFDDEALVDSETFSEWLEPFLEQSAPVLHQDTQSIAAIIFTSGSTGQPKGVMLSQQALMASGYEMARHYDWQREVLLSMGPLSMMSGLRNACVSSLVSASTVLVPATCTRRYPTTAWEQAAQAGATVITTVPSWLTMLLARPISATASALKQVLLTGTPLDEQLQRDAEETLGCRIGNYYGLTETGGICTGTLLGSTRSVGTLGRPTSNALVQLVDEQGEMVGAGEVGEIRVRSNQLMSGYLNNPEATAAILSEGWIWTGDQGCWDEDNNLVLIGRSDDAIKLRDGSLFHPQSLEKLLVALPGVMDAAVTLTGSPGKLTALMVCHGPLEEVRELFISHHGSALGPRRLPELWSQVESLPRNSNGKIQRKLLVELI
ncbi:AMP-binding protein [Porticoccus sp.]